jgi:hypothetical protein
VTEPPASTPTKSQSITGPLALWLSIQLLALSLASSRLPLSAHYPQPPEALAFQLMAIVQTIGLAMLLPVLLRSHTHALAIALTAGPMLQLAGVLAQAPFARVLLVWVNITVFLAALVLCGRQSQRGGRMWIVAIANLLTLGGVIVAYLDAEFSALASIDAIWFSPTVAAMSLARSDAVYLKQWVIVVAMCVAGAVTSWVKRHPAAK